MSSNTDQQHAVGVLASLKESVHVVSDLHEGISIGRLKERVFVPQGQEGVSVALCEEGIGIRGHYSHCYDDGVNSTSSTGGKVLTRGQRRNSNKGKEQFHGGLACGSQSGKLIALE